jgi:hypothetical protein
MYVNEYDSGGGLSRQTLALAYPLEIRSIDQGFLPAGLSQMIGLTCLLIGMLGMVWQGFRLFRPDKL